MNEMDLLHQIMLVLSAKGIKIFRINVGRVKMADGRWFNAVPCVGFSDLTGVMPGGKAVFIECKVGKNKLSKEQEKFLQVMKKQGALCGVAYSVEDAIKIVRGEP